jgi:hypothetical protein
LPDPVKRLVLGEGASRTVEAASDVVPISKGSTSLPNGECRAILVGTAGTLNIITATGELRSLVPFQAGISPIRIKGVLAGGTADNLWALY